MTQCDGLLIKDLSEEHFRDGRLEIPDDVYDFPPEVVTNLTLNNKVSNSIVLSYANGTVTHLVNDKLIWKLDFEAGPFFNLKWCE